MSTKTETGMLVLNPNAPLFIPAAYLAAEDFSPEWWHLVQTCPAFRDYWLRERYDAIDDGATPFDDADEFDVIDDVIDIQNEMQMEELEYANDLTQAKRDNGNIKETEKDLLQSLVSLNLNGTPSQRQWREPLKHHEKITNNSPRSPRRGSSNQLRIHQPRSQ